MWADPEREHATRVTVDSDFQNVGCRDPYSADLFASSVSVRFTGSDCSEYAIHIAGSFQIPDYSVPDKGPPYGV